MVEKIFTKEQRREIKYKIGSLANSYFPHRGDFLATSAGESRDHIRSQMNVISNEIEAREKLLSKDKWTRFLNRYEGISFELKTKDLACALNPTPEVRKEMDERVGYLEEIHKRMSKYIIGKLKE